MSQSRHSIRITSALAAGLMLATVATGAVLAHPESEGPHPSGCVVTVEPGSVPVGGQFTVAVNFGGASIFLVEGAGSSPAEGAQPDATTPEGQSVNVTFTAEASDVGEWTVWGLLPESECGDSDGLVVTAAPNTAMRPPSWALPLGAVALAAAGALAVARGSRSPRLR